jgi:hypothetical protein
VGYEWGLKAAVPAGSEGPPRAMWRTVARGDRHTFWACQNRQDAFGEPPGGRRVSSNKRCAGPGTRLLEALGKVDIILLCLAKGGKVFGGWGADICSPRAKKPCLISALIGRAERSDFAQGFKRPAATGNQTMRATQPAGGGSNRPHPYSGWMGGH